MLCQRYILSWRFLHGTEVSNWKGKITDMISIIYDWGLVRSSFQLDKNRVLAVAIVCRLLLLWEYRFPPPPCTDMFFRAILSAIILSMILLTAVNRLKSCSRSRTTLVRTTISVLKKRLNILFNIFSLPGSQYEVLELIHTRIVL